MYATMLMKKDADLGGMVNPALAGRFGHDQQMLTGPASPPASTSPRITNSTTNGPQA